MLKHPRIGRYIHRAEALEGVSLQRLDGSRQVMRLRFRCEFKSVSRTNNKLFSLDFLLYLPPLVSDNTQA